MKHVMVCYRAGYGGSFIAGMIEKALGIGDGPTPHHRDRNSYEFKNSKVYGFNAKNLVDLVKIGKQAGYKDKLFRESIGDDYDSNHHFTQHSTLADMLQDEDYDKFIANLVDFFSDVSASGDYVVSSIHYDRPIEGFSIWMLKHDLVPIFLLTKDVKLSMLFKFLGCYKTNWFNLRGMPAEVIRGYIKRQISTPLFDSMLELDVGRLFFDEYTDEASRILSGYVGREINLDKDLINDYKLKNGMILSQFLGDDYMLASIDDLSDRLERVYRSKL